MRLESGAQLGELAARDVPVLRTEHHTVWIADRHAREAERLGSDADRLVDGSGTSRLHGRSAGRKLARPIATVALDATPRASSASSMSATPPFVSTENDVRRVRFVACR